MKHKGLIAVVVVVAAILYFTGGLNGLFETGTINVKFFDANGNPVGTDSIKSVVTSSSGSVLAQNVANMQFTIKAKNTGELPLVVSLNTLTPSQLDSAFTKIDKTIAPGEETTWTSSLVPTAQFDGTSKTFYVKIRGTYTYAGETKTIDKEGSVAYSFAIDPIAGLSVTFGSSLVEQIWVLQRMVERHRH